MFERVFVYSNVFDWLLCWPLQWRQDPASKFTFANQGADGVRLGGCVAPDRFSSAQPRSVSRLPLGCPGACSSIDTLLLIILWLPICENQTALKPISRWPRGVKVSDLCSSLANAFFQFCVFLCSNARPGGKGHRSGERRHFFIGILSHSLYFTSSVHSASTWLTTLVKYIGRGSGFPLPALNSFVYAILWDLIPQLQTLVNIIITWECCKHADSRPTGLVWVLTLCISSPRCSSADPTLNSTTDDRCFSYLGHVSVSWELLKMIIPHPYLSDSIGQGGTWVSVFFFFFKSPSWFIWGRSLKITTQDRLLNY